jgi:hypothetical protein
MYIIGVSGFEMIYHLDSVTTFSVTGYFLTEQYFTKNKLIFFGTLMKQIFLCGGFSEVSILDT